MKTTAKTLSASLLLLGLLIGCSNAPATSGDTDQSTSTTNSNPVTTTCNTGSGTSQPQEVTKYYTLVVYCRNEDKTKVPLSALSFDIDLAIGSDFRFTIQRQPCDKTNYLSFNWSTYDATRSAYGFTLPVPTGGLTGTITGALYTSQTDPSLTYTGLLDFYLYEWKYSDYYVNNTTSYVALIVESAPVGTPRIMPGETRTKNFTISQ
ncbi:MAG: hypothetical protein D6767_06925 [Candidatus Hydrogenedentota bacterium]|nr:MAG: hypothetical protein D6767_06925 [Candidatus Hydrogenedentota bacterium]